MSVVVLTGATAGIGRQAARQLAEQGHTLILVGRNATHGERLARDTNGMFVRADISTMDGVVRVADRVRQTTDHVDVLINNAGVMTPRREVTAEGFELNFAVHHLAPFSLTGQLLPLLRHGEGRVVNVNSEGHRAPLRGSGPVLIPFDDLQSSRAFNTFLVYSNTKLANLLFTYELHRRHPELTVVALHPGMVRTDLGRSFPRALVAVMGALSLSPSQGARPVVHLATAPDVVGGGYYNRFTHTDSSPASRDLQSAQRLWDVTERLRGPFASVGRLRDNN